MLAGDRGSRQSFVSRRQAILFGAAACTAVILPKKAKSSAYPLGMTSYGLAYRASVNQPALITQQCAEWCWAASIAMIFASHGHDVDQKVFVQALYGNPLTCAPAGYAINIARALSSSWVDANGQSFQSTVTAAYDANFGVAINNSVIVDELSNNRPLLYCNTHHAMVVVQADYIPSSTPYGVPSIFSVGVLDPWPYYGFHLLSQPEIYPLNVPGGQMTFLASVQTT